MVAKVSAVPRTKRLPLAWLCVLGLGIGAWLGAQEPAAPGDTAVPLLAIDDAIGPATSDFIVRGIERAQRGGAPFAVIEMDTPGGLDSAMRDIIQAILASAIPVVTYVSPQGARAASAGTYILYASHVAAMAPATNLGAATPVAIGGAQPSDTPEQPEERSGGGAEDAEPDDGAGSEPRGAPTPSTASERKAINDAVAYIRSLAEQRGRNAEWAEAAVRSAESLSAESALARDVIDLIATDLADLLEKLDGRVVAVAGNRVTLATEGVIFERVEADWRTKFLAVISNPTVAYMLMLLGIYGLIFEGYNPGALVPGVVGAISLLLALFAFQILPVNYAGLGLIALGVVLMIAEFLVPSFGALGIGGVAAFILGSVILIDSDVPGYGVSTPLIATIALTASAAMLGVIWIAMRSRMAPVVTGVEAMQRTIATALEDFENEGAVWAHGERWRARSPIPVRKGEALRITSIEGLLLHVEPVDTAGR